MGLFYNLCEEILAECITVQKDVPSQKDLYIITSYIQAVITV